MWDKIPAFRILLPFLAGILFSLHMSIPEIVIVIIFWLLLLVYACFVLIEKFSSSFKLHYIRGVVLQLVLFFGGVYIIEIKNPVNSNNYFDNYLDANSIVEARVLFPPEEREKTIKLVVSIESISDSSLHNYKTSGKSLIYLRKDSLHIDDIAYGDILYLKNNFMEVDPIKNPHEFDYKKYLANQGVYYTAFFKEGEYVKGDVNTAKGFWKMIFASRLYFEHLLQKYIDDEDALSVSSALLLGVRTNINDDIENAYANTGTMHILSVSGLHVGILFIILDWLMRFVPYFKINRPRNKLMKALLIVFIIWFYACITGLSPSVSRSAVMFSFLIFGRLGTRYVNSFNILACSAIPLLVANPFMVTQVGFQLSYLAILGILTFQPPLSKLFVPNTLVGKYLWSLGTVSVGAQLGTVPVTILYFHQFPNYFLLSNILAIPISFVVLIAGIMFFALSFIPQINFITGWLLEFSMKALNYVVVLVDKIPGALADNLFITIPETILFYIILFFAGTFIFLKNKKYILYMTALTCLLFVSVGIRKYFHVQQEEVGIYSLPKSFAIAEIHGLQAKIYSPDSLNIESPDFTYHIQNDLISKGIKKYEFIRLEDMRSETLSYQNYFLIDTILFYTIDKKFEHPETAIVQVDYIIVMNNPYLKINEVKEYFPESALIFSSSNNYRSLNYWRNYCDEHATGYHDMKRDGYLSVRN